jgi:anti-sigma factor RsiW
MKCNEIRNLVLAYLGSELDAKTTQEIEIHLHTCAECAELFEQERKFNERAFRVLRRGQPTPQLWEQLESKLVTHPWWKRLWERMPAARLGLAATAAAAVVLLAVAVWPRAQVPDLALAVAQDHQEFLDGKFAPDFSGALPDTVARRLDQRLDAAAFGRLPSAHGFAVKGSRLCFLRGVPAAWTLGYYANVAVSVVVLKQTELEHFPQIKQRLESGEPVICARTGPYHFAARLVGDHVVCALGQTSMLALEAIVKSVGNGA